MKNSIVEGQTLKKIEKNIESEITDCEYWGDLDISYEEVEALKERLKVVLHADNVTPGYVCRNYPHAVTTFMVFFVRYKYDINFWRVLGDELDLDTSGNNLHSLLGTCAKKMFYKYEMDFSDTKEEPHQIIAPIIYEACLPPESSLDDLFYVLSYDTYRVFDPQLIIDELIEMRSYTIRKPMYRFLSRFKDDRAVDFLLEVRDAMIAVDQNNPNSSRYAGNYIEWKQNEKNKSYIANRKNQEFQTKPYLVFDIGKKGLCIILPHTVLSTEWVDEVEWVIQGENGFLKRIKCNVMGDEGRRYTDSLTVAVPPQEKYEICLDESDEWNDKATRNWTVDGLSNGGILFFNNNGRQINTNYLLYPYEIMIISQSVVIKENKSVNIADQYYPMCSSNARIISVSPQGGDARFKYESDGETRCLYAKPQVNLILHGKSIFSLETGVNIFTDIPKLEISVDGMLPTNDMEVRFNGETCPISIINNDVTTVLLSSITDISMLQYGTYSVRLYQAGRFFIQVEFSYVPKIKTNYSPLIKWSTALERKGKTVYKFQKLEEWEMDFDGCNVTGDDDNYIVTVPANVGSVKVKLRSLQPSLRFECHFELPIKPFMAEIIDIDGNPVENATDRVVRLGADDLTESEMWLSLQTFGEYRKGDYKVRLRSANGIEQSEDIKLAQNGACNFNLSIFNDTIRNCPLPAEIELIYDGDEEKMVVLITVSEKLALEKRVRFRHNNDNNKDYIVLDIEDDGKDIDVIRFGFERNIEHIPYAKSKLSSKGIAIGYVYPGEMKDGLYIISANKGSGFFDFEDDEEEELSIGNNILYVNRKRKNEIRTSRDWLDILVSEVISSDKNTDISESKAYRILMNKNILESLEKSVFEDEDIERLVALGFFVNSKIIDSKKGQIKQCMRKISERFMHRGDRYRIIELLVDINAPQEVFDICLNEYALLLVYSDNKEAKSLASAVDVYSTELSMVLMMGADASVRDCVWREKYRDLIGKDAIRLMLDVPGEKGPEKVVEEQKAFLREIEGNLVRIKLTSEISGNADSMQRMIAFDKKGNAYLDITKKPDFGVYFGRIKYVDQYANWYKSSHDRFMNIKPEIRDLMNQVVKEYYEVINEHFEYLKIDSKLSRIAKQYLRAVNERLPEGATITKFSSVSYPMYFYYQALAAFLAKLPADRERLDDLRIDGIRFMSAAYIIAPKLSERDILMAETFIYLKRKEEQLCR